MQNHLLARFGRLRRQELRFRILELGGFALLGHVFFTSSGRHPAPRSLLPTDRSCPLLSVIENGAVRRDLGWSRPTKGLIAVALFHGRREHADPGESCRAPGHALPPFWTADQGLSSGRHGARCVACWCLRYTQSLITPRCAGPRSGQPAPRGSPTAVPPGGCWFRSTPARANRWSMTRS